MDIRPIKTDADYAAAVAEVDRLMDTVPGTPEGDRLDVLAILVQAHEDRFWPMEGLCLAPGSTDHRQRYFASTTCVARSVGTCSTVRYPRARRSKPLKSDSPWPSATGARAR